MLSTIFISVKKWHDGHKIKHETCLYQLQTPRKKKSQGYYLPSDWNPLLFSTRIITLKLFFSKGFIYPLTIKHNHMINPTRNNEVYYVSLLEYIMCFLAIVKENCTQRYILNIPINMYTWINYMRKYHLFVHIYPTITYNSMNGYHPHFHLIS